MSSSIAEVDRIRILNDQLRQLHCGGMVVISRGLAALDRAVWADVIRAVAAFDAFSQDNDSYGEHDCSVVDVGGLSVIWKIDYFDPTLLHHSDNAADPGVTRRVMTIMLEEEY
ncbi:DUF3768 domain-containing protein [Mesorhizobium sp. B1-1-8]|uniref:DUF3768 domain-containing protein n=1 Tax=Mesorhizobium sp. B1-1-8 TaxID=2589976 RepID=UPI0011263405|nr:DUF3768 domain-containing protein [Mesorhizobium sp. B1-1-8]UCI07332.1 DUF3768 domain-containing protein [Mesorhizobium sp. B1-1-8]